MKSTLLFFICVFSLCISHAQQPFITTWDTRNIGVSDNTQIIFYATGNNFQIGWVNMSDASDTGNAVGINDANTISFSSPGIYKVYISPGSGSFSAFTLCINNNVTIIGDAKKLLSIEQWGDINWSTFNTAFANCDSMVMNAPDMPNLSNVINMSAAFYNCGSLTTNEAMSNWNVSKVKNMSRLFYNDSLFNQPIGNWNVKNVTDMTWMFLRNVSFNQSIGNWNVSKVIGMYGMFEDAIVFNQPIGNWNTGNVLDMEEMFGSALSFNQPIGNWNVSKVKRMRGMFGSAHSFNQPIGNWNVSNATDMNGMLRMAKSFNQPIGNWNVSNVTDMANMFTEAYAFNQPIGNWNVSNVTDMTAMFLRASVFNQLLSNWNVNKVTKMFLMFGEAKSFNQTIGNWNVSNVTDMAGMFGNAISFDQPLDKWNVSKVSSMYRMFEDAHAFNQNLGSWNLSGAPTITNIFDSSGMSCSNYSLTLSGWAGSTSTPNGLSLGAVALTYDSAFAKAAHDSLINIKGWTITGDKIDQCSILPVSLLFFTATKQQQSVLLNWQTANEINNDYFSVERSNNSRTFNAISKVYAQQKQSYSTIDNYPLQGINYYRLKQVDKDGKFTYSKIVSVLFNNEMEITIHPNPANKFMYVDGLKENTSTDILITDVNGKTVLSVKANQSSNKINIQNLAAGVYYINIIQNGKSIKQKFIKQ